MKTVNRGWLLRKAKAGKLVYLDGYFPDHPLYPYGFRGNEVPVRLIENEDNEHSPDYHWIEEYDFRAKPGHAAQEADGIIHLLSGYRSVLLKLID